MKVVRKVERVVSRVLQPLVDKLMDYFSGEVNYTLAGYVSKILSFLSNKKPLNVIYLQLSSFNTSFNKSSWLVY